MKRNIKSFKSFLSKIPKMFGRGKKSSPASGKSNKPVSPSSPSASKSNLPTKPIGFKADTPEKKRWVQQRRHELRNSVAATFASLANSANKRPAKAEMINGRPPWLPLVTNEQGYEGFSPIGINASIFIRDVFDLHFPANQRTPKTIDFKQFIDVLCTWLIVKNGLTAAAEGKTFITGDPIDEISRGIYGFSNAQLVTARVGGWRGVGGKDGNTAAADRAAIEKTYNDPGFKNISVGVPRPVYALLQQQIKGFDKRWSLIAEMNWFLKTSHTHKWIYDGGSAILVATVKKQKDVLDRDGVLIKLWLEWKEEYMDWVPSKTMPHTDHDKGIDIAWLKD